MKSAISEIWQRLRNALLIRDEELIVITLSKNHVMRILQKASFIKRKTNRAPHLRDASLSMP